MLISIISFPFKLIICIFTGGHYNPWKKNNVEENILPDEMVKLQLVPAPFCKEKLFIKEWDLLFDPSSPLIVTYICKDLPWQSYHVYLDIKDYLKKPPNPNFSYFTGKEAVEKYKDNFSQCFEGVVCRTLYDKIIESNLLETFSSRSITEEVLNSKREAIEYKRILSKITEAIKDNKIPERCRNEDCKVSFYKKLPDSDGCCSLCGHGLENDDQINLISNMYDDFD